MAWYNKLGNYVKSGGEAVVDSYKQSADRFGDGDFVGGISSGLKATVGAIPNAVSGGKVGEFWDKTEEKIRGRGRAADPSVPRTTDMGTVQTQQGNMQNFLKQFGGQFASGMTYNPQAVQSDAGNQNQALAMMSAQAAGNSPQMQTQMAAARGNAMADALSLAASQRDPAAAALATRQAIANQGTVNSQLQAQQGQQQMEAMKAYGQMANDARAQEIQQAQYNQAAGLQAQQLRNDLMAKYMSAGLTAEQATLQAEVEMANIRQSGINAAQQGKAQMLGSGVGAIGAIGAAIASDRRLKKDIKGHDMRGFLDALSAHEYEYKDASQPYTAPGKRVGIMAQDLERSEAGKSIVRETSMGKIIDVNQGFGVALAAMADLNKRVRAMEAR